MTEQSGSVELLPGHVIRCRLGGIEHTIEHQQWRLVITSPHPMAVLNRGDRAFEIINTNCQGIAAMGTAEQKAHELAAQLAAGGLAQRVAFDPLTIVALIGLIVGVVNLIMQCVKKNPAAAAKRAAAPGLLDRLRLRLLVRRHLRGHAALKASLTAAQAGLLAMGKTATAAELESIHAQAINEEKSKCPDHTAAS